jgi:hypothetical protein
MEAIVGAEVMSGTTAVGDRLQRSRIDHRTGKPVLFHDESFWRAHEQRRLESGQTISEYCAAHRLALSTFRRWSAKLGGKRPVRKSASASSEATLNASAAFLQVPVHRQPACAADERVQVELDGVRVTLTGSAAARVIEAVMLRLGAPR